MDDAVDNPTESSGIRPSELLSLPAQHRRVLQVIMRLGELTYSDICTAVKNLPAEEQVAESAIADILQALVDGGSITVSRVEDVERYRVKINPATLKKRRNSLLDKLNFDE